MQQKDADEWKYKEDDGKTTLLEDIPSDVYFCSISHMTHIRLSRCQSSSIPIYPIVHMMSHIILLFLICSSTFFRVCNISFMAALHPHQCCVSSLLMLCFMTHIAHNDAITTSSLHHSFSHYETAFLYIRASLAHVLYSQFKLYSLAFTSA